MKEYLFDVKLFASIRVKAEDEAQARERLFGRLDTTSIWDEESDKDVMFECSMDGDADLIEIDGVDV